MTAAKTSGSSILRRKRSGKGSESAFERSRRRLYLPIIAPALVVYLALVIGPTLAAIWVSLNNWGGTGSASFAGFDNFASIFTDNLFWLSFKNTLIIIFIGGAATFLISFFLMMVLREMRGRGLARAIIFFPVITSQVAIAVAWGFLFNAEGLVNTALGALNLPTPAWLSAGNLLFFTILMGLVWVTMGLYTTILMAGVDRIPKYFYEDCKLNGANAFQQFLYVTLPLTWEVISVAAIIWTINAVKIFEFIYTIGSAGSAQAIPPQSIWNSPLYVYYYAFGGGGAAFQFGKASAAALAALVLVVLLVPILQRVFRSESIEY